MAHLDATGYNRGVNTKKASWINRPYIEAITLHSFTYRSNGTHSVFFVLGENGEITLSAKTSVRSAFVLLHTPEEYIRIEKECIFLSFGGVMQKIPAECGESAKMVKEGKRISFFSEGKLLLAIEKDAFLSSAAFGFSSDGEGEVCLEVF